MCFAWFSRMLKYIWSAIADVFQTLFETMTGCYRIDKLVKARKSATRSRQIEKILKSYPNERIRSLDWDTGDETEAAEAILVEETGRDEESDQLQDMSKSLAKTMRQIRGYQKLYTHVEERRLTQYNRKNQEHEDALMRLWYLLMQRPYETETTRINGDMDSLSSGSHGYNHDNYLHRPSSSSSLFSTSTLSSKTTALREVDDKNRLTGRITKQWEQIGFQGDDPATDFRGMGILGLDQLVFFAQFDVDNCQRVLSISRHPKIGFPFAVCGIHITLLCKDLLLDEMLKNHFYNAVEPGPPLTMDHFNQVYCRVFSLFADYWLAVDPESVMEFNEVYRKFISLIEAYLQRPDANLLSARIEDLAGAPAVTNGRMGGFYDEDRYRR